MPRRILALTLTAICLIAARGTFALGLDPAFTEPMLGPEKAEGVVVYSHGRSNVSEDYKSRLPPYMLAFLSARFDTYRFDRLKAVDSLEVSSWKLIDYVKRLKQSGYKRIVLVGQSFGAFLSLMAADKSEAVDAVIAIAPAAYGTAEDGEWELNATRLYPLIAAVRHARTMLFFFTGDIYDPGGRGDRSRAILAAQKYHGYAVIDRPPGFTTHWAAMDETFKKVFGPCIVSFSESGALANEYHCIDAPLHTASQH